MDIDYDRSVVEAKKILNKYNISSVPIIVDTIIKDYGINIKSVSFNEKMKDISGFIDIKEKSIYINNDDSLERQNFTKAHEFGHYILHSELFKKDPSKQLLLREGKTNDTKEEKEANAFASELLIPEHILKKMIIQYRNYGIVELATLFGVSLSFMSFRIKNIMR
ncbi:MAG: ImmA/IrrE family metallo-endopeptidase [Rickettsiales bacterium]|nr:MAG: ImmA/IrrE family metallo-endopeptidase [Rickettsiales bacterium]